jgi:hypothetical protein
MQWRITIGRGHHQGGIKQQAEATKGHSQSRTGHPEGTTLSEWHYFVRDGRSRCHILTVRNLCRGVDRCQVRRTNRCRELRVHASVPSLKADFFLTPDDRDNLNPEKPRLGSTRALACRWTRLASSRIASAAALDPPHFFVPRTRTKCRSKRKRAEFPRPVVSDVLNRSTAGSRNLDSSWSAC